MSRKRANSGELNLSSYALRSKDDDMLSRQKKKLAKERESKNIFQQSDSPSKYYNIFKQNIPKSTDSSDDNHVEIAKTPSPKNSEKRKSFFSLVNKQESSLKVTNKNLQRVRKSNVSLSMLSSPSICNLAKDEKEKTLKNVFNNSDPRAEQTTIEIDDFDSLVNEPKDKQKDKNDVTEILDSSKNEPKDVALTNEVVPGIEPAKNDDVPDIDFNIFEQLKESQEKFRTSVLDKLKQINLKISSFREQTNGPNGL